MAILFTQEGFDKMKHDLEEAKKKRPEAVATLARARAMGDLSENGFYKGARFELSDLDRKIRHLTRLVENGRVIQKPANNETVQIGHTVILKRINWHGNLPVIFFLRLMLEREIFGEDGKKYSALEMLVENAVFNFRNIPTILDPTGQEYPYTLKLGCYQAILETGIDSSILFPVLAQQSNTQPDRLHADTRLSPQEAFIIFSIDIIYQEALIKYPELKNEVTQRAFEDPSSPINYHDWQKNILGGNIHNMAEVLIQKLSPADEIAAEKFLANFGNPPEIPEIVMKHGPSPKLSFRHESQESVSILQVDQELLLLSES